MCSGQRRDRMLKEQSTKGFVEGGPGFKWTFPDRIRRAEMTRHECKECGRDRLWKRLERGRDDRLEKRVCEVGKKKRAVDRLWKTVHIDG